MIKVLIAIFWALSSVYVLFGIIINCRAERRQDRRMRKFEALKPERKDGYKEFCKELKKEGVAVVNGTTCYYYRENFVIVADKVIELTEDFYNKLVGG